VPVFERQRVEHPVKLLRVDRFEPRVQEELAEGLSRQTGLLDQPFDREPVCLMRLELEEAQDGNGMLGPDPPELFSNELVGQLERLRDLNAMGDLSKSEYVLRRQALEEELARAAPPFDPRLDKAEELLADFGRVWQLEDDPAKRRRLLATLFDRVW
jgi:hypothetical protein